MLKNTLKLAGINTDLFRDHSTRSTSSLKASMGGAPLIEVLKRGSWSHHSVWQGFHNKDIIQKGHVFQDMVYKDSGKKLTLYTEDWRTGLHSVKQVVVGKFSIKSRRFYEMKVF